MSTSSCLGLCTALSLFASTAAVADVDVVNDDGLCRFRPPPTVISLTDPCFPGPHEPIEQEGCEASVAFRVDGPRSQRDFFVSVDGPGGSGRFWTVVVGLPGDEQRPPSGVMLSTTTIGWRNTPPEAAPLSFVRDLDGDGVPELLLWASFPLVDAARASNAEYAIVAWVYRHAPLAQELRLDWELTRARAAELARLFADDSDGDGRDIVTDRASGRTEGAHVLAASALRRLADGRCGG